jgi:SAM-dependent methyltransferase
LSVTAHYVTDYRALAARLLREHSVDQAMALGVGGNYAEMGAIEADMVKQFELEPTHYLIDVGCGSGRLPTALGEWHDGDYLGTDVVPEFLDYAKAQNPDCRFEIVDGLGIPEREGVADMVVFFSVLTHLRPEEGYCYLKEAYRVLKTGGTCLVSFLEYEFQWSEFEKLTTDPNGGDHLVTFLNWQSLWTFANHIGFGYRYLARNTALGQSLMVLTKRA